MVFSSLEFLFLFLPIVFLEYILIKPNLANAWLFASSLFFYYMGAKDQLWLLLTVIAICYFTGLLMGRTKNTAVRRLLLIGSVGCMLLTMTYFKYWNFLIYNTNLLFHSGWETREILLPIGISFFTFQAISYVVDIYRGEKALTNPIDMGLYISFFPQLIAGPIVRFHNVAQYLDKRYRQISRTSIEEGIWRFCIGLCKKVLFANNLGVLVNIVFSVRDISNFSVLYTWLGVIAYTLQIYFDFSGYSDMAIGLGKLFGFEFQENFNYPYCASSIQDFWRRWHISLSQFFRDYVYIPLGGNRCSTTRWIFNLLCVWMLTGIWHGAAWSYIIWGVTYGILLLLERFLLPKVADSKIKRIAGHIYTMFLVMVLWAVFKTEHLSVTYKYIKNMFGIGASCFIGNDFIFQAKNYAVLILLSIFFSLPITEKLDIRLGHRGWYQAAKAVLLFLGVVSSVSYIYMGSYNPFLYFMF